MPHHDPFRPAEGADASSSPGQDPDGNGEPDHLNRMRSAELVSLCDSLGLDKTGSRKQLIARVRNAQRQQDTGA